MKLNLNIDPISSWLPTGTRPYVISGPCSVETETQMMQSAREVSGDKRVNILRGGIWKPRTRPNSFEGVGEKGLAWLKNASMEADLPCATEVANASHVEACLKAGIDILWIGARSTVNPFSVQEIADALKGVDIPVFIKNPINPDLDLWIGALERINQAGISKLAAIHRGFSSFEKSAFRNIPMWEIPIELKRRCSEIEILCDHSHIAGNRDLLQMVSQKAMDLDMDGLMIESHPIPEEALSDSKQQVTPQVLSQILDDIIIRNNEGDSAFGVQMNTFREQIDKLDDDIIQKFGSRMSIAESIGKYKKENNVTILQVERWDKMVSDWHQMGKTLNLNKDFINKLLKLIHEESIRKQTEVMND